MMFFNRKSEQTLEQEHSTLVQDLVDLTKLLGQARQEDIMQKTEKSRQKVEGYVRAIEACQVRLVRLNDRINRGDT